MRLGSCAGVVRESAAACGRVATTFDHATNVNVAAFREAVATNRLVTKTDKSVRRGCPRSDAKRRRGLRRTHRHKIALAVLSWACLGQTTSCGDAAELGIAQGVANGLSAVTDFLIRLAVGSVLQESGAEIPGGG